MTSFNVLSYNIMVPVPEPIRFYGQRERAQRVKDVIRDLDQKHNLDVVILNEVCTPESQSIVFTDLPSIGFAHRTKKLTDVFIAASGGVILFSKHPITQEACTIFGDKCLGADCLAAKAKKAAEGEQRKAANAAKLQKRQADHDARAAKKMREAEQRTAEAAARTQAKEQAKADARVQK